MLQPKRTKFRKQMKGRNRGLAQRGSTVSFGEFALKATGRGRMTARQIEAARRAMTRYIKRGGKIWIRVFPDKPITKKPLEVRQGKGKGNVEYWVCPDPAGSSILYEMYRVSLRKWPVRRSSSQRRSCRSPQRSFAVGDVMEASELRNKTRKNWVRSCSSCASEQFNLRMQKATGQLRSTPNTGQRERKRDIARVKTV
jgi:large subunit ribosomal protein L16